MRHKCRMAAIETEANAKIRKSLIGRSRPMRGNYVPGDLVYYWRAGGGVHEAQGHWLGPARVIGVEGGNVWVSHRATAIKCAKEQLRMASPAEREMREMLMRIGGDDPDERSKHGVPRQQDLTQQQRPTESPPQKQRVSPQSSSQPLKQQSRKEFTTTTISPRTETTGETRCTETGTSTRTSRVETKSRTTATATTENNEFEFKRIRQQLMMDGESDFVLWKQVHRKWRLIKCQSLSCFPFQKMMI